MSKSPPPHEPQSPPEAALEARPVRRRFGDGETVVMPLADILRARGDAEGAPAPPGPPQAAAPHPADIHSERTSIGQMPAGLRARPPEATSPAVPAGLTAAQAALLSRTEPPAATVVARRPDALARPAQAPASPREATVRVSLAAVSRGEVTGTSGRLAGAPPPAATPPPHPAQAATPAPAARATSAPGAPGRGSPSALPSVQSLTTTSEGMPIGRARARPEAPPSPLEQALAADPAPKEARQPAAAPAAGRSRRRPKNPVVVFFSCKGGSGATALSTNAAFCAAREGHSACLVDLDLQLGDALASLGLNPRFTIAQASGALAEKEPLGRSLLPTHASGVAVLSQVGALDDLDKISPESMATLVQAARQTFDVVVVDGVRDFNDNVLAVLDVADKISIVTVQEVLAIRRARWTFSILRKIGFDPQDVTIVVSRFSSSGDIALGSIQAMFEPATVLTVPNDAAVSQSLGRGVPLMETRAQSDIGRRLGEVYAHVLYNDAVGATAAPSELDADGRPLWKRILGRPRGTP